MRHYLKAINSLVPVLLAALVLVGCGDFEKPREVSLAMLTENATNFDNNQVITRGHSSSLRGTATLLDRRRRFESGRDISSRASGSLLGRSCISRGTLPFLGH